MCELIYQEIYIIGGTQAIPLPSYTNGHKEYITFFHSSLLMTSKHSKGKRVQHYFMGAYTFQPYPPFKIIRVSKQPLFIPGLYNSEVEYPTYKPIKCVFPTGILLEFNITKLTYELILLFGKQDFESWKVHLDMEVFLRDNLIVVR